MTSLLAYSIFFAILYVTLIGLPTYYSNRIERKAQNCLPHEFGDRDFVPKKAYYLLAGIVVFMGIGIALSANRPLSDYEFGDWVFFGGLGSCFVLLGLGGIIELLTTHASITDGIFEYRKWRKRLRIRMIDIRDASVSGGFIVIDIGIKYKIGFPQVFRDAYLLLAMLKYYRPHCSSSTDISSEAYLLAYSRQEIPVVVAVIVILLPLLFCGLLVWAMW